MNTILESLYRGEDLPADELMALFGQVVKGQVPPVLLTALLVGLKIKGERGEEIAAAAKALQAAARPFPIPDYLFADSCGTGGDGKGTLNVSTAVAFVSAACGLPIAKHGNRSVSSRSGSADVLEQLGVEVRIEPDAARRCLDEAGVAFLFAPDYHPGIAHAMPVRKALGTRTLFNVLGPLVNPARPAVQLVGVYAPELLTPVADALCQLGVRSALVVHGGGLDEVALHGVTEAIRIEGGIKTRVLIEPEEVGLSRQPVEAIAGGSVQYNAEALDSILRGAGNRAYRDAVALNTGALLWVAGLAHDLKSGCDQALVALSDGAAYRHLEKLRRLSRGA